MRKQLIFASVAMLLATMLLIWGFAPDILRPGAGETPLMALVLDTDIGVHAATIKQGAKLAARELKAELIAAAPSPLEDMETAQVQLMKKLIAQGVKALLLVPGGDMALAEAELLTKEANVRLVLLDAGAHRGTSYVGTDHAASGAQAAQAMLELGPDAPDALVLSSPGWGVCEERLQGAQTAIDGASGAVKSTVAFCADAEAADMAVRQAIRNNPGINAMLCLNGALSEGAARALSALGRTDICLIGFDCDQTRVTYLQSGVVRATVLRSPLNIGYLGLARALEPGPDVFTPSYLVDATNMLDPEFVKLVFPLVQ